MSEKDFLKRMMEANGGERIEVDIFECDPDTFDPDKTEILSYDDGINYKVETTKICENITLKRFS